MTPQELKNSILKLAIQGKLVEQREEEGTAEELYQQIQEEKQRLVKDVKIKKQKALPEITEDEIPFDIPENWKWVKFGNSVDFNMGKTPPRAEPQWWSNDVPWVSIADMPEGGIITETKESVSYDAISSKFSGRIVPKNTLIMSFKLTVGKVSILGIDAVHNEAIISIEPIIDEENTARNYLFHVLPFMSSYGETKSAIKGKTLNKESLNNLLIPLPPLAEQKRIVAKIEELLPYIDKYEKAWTKLEGLNKKFPDDLQKSILQLAIQGKLVEQREEEGTAEELYKQIQEKKQRLISEGKIKKRKSLPEITEDEIPFDIPNSWKWVRLGSLCTKLVDGDHNPPKGENCETPYLMLSAQNINNNSIVDLDSVRYLSADNFQKTNERTRLEKGDILFTIVGSMGRSCVHCGGDTFTFQRSVAVITCSIFNYYFKYVLDSPLTQNFMYANATGTAQKGFYLNQVEKLIFPLPPLEEQKRIVAKIEELLPLCEKLK